MALITYLVGALVSLVAFLFFYIRRNYGQLERLGIPVDPPFFIFGSGPWALHKVRGRKDAISAALIITRFIALARPSL